MQTVCANPTDIREFRSLCCVSVKETLAVAIPVVNREGNLDNRQNEMSNVSLCCFLAMALVQES